MTVRFFMLQAHYRSTLDFSNDALEAAEKGYRRLMNAIGLLEKIEPRGKKSTQKLQEYKDRCYAAMNDDFNTPILLAEIFELVRLINSIYDGKTAISPEELTELSEMIHAFVFDVLGLKDEGSDAQNNDTEGLMDIIIDIRNKAKEDRDFETSDKIRESLQEIGIQVKDGKEGTVWNKI